MKEKVIIFLAGLILGAIISTGAIYFYTIAENNNGQPDIQIQNGNKGINGGENGQMGNPPEMPSNNQGQQTN